MEASVLSVRSDSIVMNKFFDLSCGITSGRNMSIQIRHALMVSALIGSLGLWAAPACAQNSAPAEDPSRKNQAQAAMLRDLREKIELLEKERARLRTSPLIQADTMTLPSQTYEEGSKLRYLERKIRTLEEENATLKSQTPLEETSPTASDDTLEATASLVKKFEAQAVLLSDENETLKRKLASLDPDFAKVYKPDTDKKIEDVLDTLFEEDGAPKPPPPAPALDKDIKSDLKTEPNSSKDKKKSSPADTKNASDKPTPDAPEKNASPLDDLPSEPAAKKTSTPDVAKDVPLAPVEKQPAPAPQAAPQENFLPETKAKAPDASPAPQKSAQEKEESAPLPVPHQDAIEITPFDTSMIKPSSTTPVVPPQQETTPAVEIAPFDPKLVTRQPITPSKSTAATPAVDIAPFDPKLVAKKSASSAPSPVASSPRVEIAPFDPSMVADKNTGSAPTGEPVKLTPGLYNQ